MSEGTRIDSWLWAARFFKTRSLAKQAVEGGKIQVDGAKAKPSKTVQPGSEVVIRKGDEQWTVRVEGLSNKRGPASVAQTLYQETEESRQQRQDKSEQRRLAHSANASPDHRPSKKERRDLARFKRDNDI
ncbi:MULTISPECIES: RNA-binding S4 domain-containing protein [Alloalcanivorax]|uniref:Heat shock protein 15 n=2 Tax=Alloalcanivorax TaxID=3020832 RepID=A0A9Q3W737_9GAMM|nr:MULTISPECIES: S4 domain-containing protein [Alloalcanivorax]ERS14703.1 ribosome-associated heat shock protein Hsp15 [Alcanivorax sp. PN-3]KYZ86065.1 RNA-binding protein [Alcanivorax sp. KX64203]PHS70419.1 MAG: RNA-binding protein [Alcanivorax sp.]ARB44431.1 tRNA synthetase RNA-binding protein [Alloalcanivorax xenomutans]MCE7510234.1 RNA-binding protein [Alloalcanivorax xenomutans]|tara:strand:+ start:1671 stop:2060 length:390 start_codon:yes stop_codon:yes gene_type:complete